MSEPQWYLSFAWGRAPYALDLPEVVIGRGEGATLQIEEAAASDEHARFVVDEEHRVWLEPIGVGEPTMLNGRAIATRTVLNEGDFVQIGHSVLTLRHGAPSQVKITSGPDERTRMPTEVPESVRQAVAARDAKNFLVGSAAPQDAPLATLMMESPLLAKGRDPQPTIEANVDDLMAAIRSNNANKEPAVTVQMAAVSEPLPEPEAQATMIAPAPQRPTPRPVRAAPHPTLMGVGPSGNTTQPVATAPTMMGEVSAMQDAVVTRPVPKVSTDSGPTRVRDTRDGVRDTDFETEELSAGPTMIAQPVERPRRSTLNEATPLPAPLPPRSTISDLSPFIADMEARTHQEAELPANMPTQELAAVNPVFKADSELPLGEQRTMLPMPAPHITASQPGVPSESGRVHAPPTARVKPIDANAPPARPLAELPYTPPAKGPFGGFSRAIDFFQQMFELTKAQKILLKPMIQNLVVATAVSVVLSLLMIFVHSGGAAYGVMVLGVTVLYFIDYYCNATTAALIYDYATSGHVDMASAQARVKKSLSGILTFAAVSALLDVGTTYARERHDIVSRMLLRVVHAIWTTATYVIMPAMIIEGIPFKDAFARSKKLMEHDPTAVGAGIVSLSMMSYIVGVVAFSLAYFFDRIGSFVHPALGMLLFFTFVNVYWALSGWIKISYSTCFYLWAQRCEAAGKSDEALAPLPLRHALAAG